MFGHKFFYELSSQQFHSEIPREVILVGACSALVGFVLCVVYSHLTIPPVVSDSLELIVYSLLQLPLETSSESINFYNYYDICCSFYKVFYKYSYVYKTVMLESYSSYFASDYSGLHLTCLFVKYFPVIGDEVLRLIFQA